MYLTYLCTLPSCSLLRIRIFRSSKELINGMGIGFSKAPVITITNIHF